MTEPIKTSSKGIVADERGAIIVIAVFMSAFLVGGLWYIMGIGDAIVYRQTVQAGADATAFTGAVYHARGMNIIAMVNIVMGAVMAIVAGATFLMQIAALIISVATTMCDLANKPPETVTEPDGSTYTVDYSDLKYACDLIDDAKALFEKLDDVVVALTTSSGSMLASLSIAQRDVARTAPWVGSSQSGVATAAYAPYVVSGGSGSPSMVPNEPRLGLPVQVEPFEKTCNRATSVLDKLIGLLVPAVLLPLLEHVDTDISDKLPQQICAGNNGGYKCMDKIDKKNVCKEYHHDSHKHGKKCEDDLEDEEKDCDHVDLVSQIDPADKSTKGMYDQARNGNDYMQVYSFVRGNMPWIQRSDPGVQAPTWGGATVAAPGTMFEDMAVAQAEFYYDQTPQSAAADTCWTPPCGLSWNSYKENTLWNLRWRARLRRYRSPTEVDVNVLSSPIADLGDVGYEDVLGSFNAGVGMGPSLLESTAIQSALGGDAAGFIGGGPAIIH